MGPSSITFLASWWRWCSSFNFFWISSLLFLSHNISFKKREYNWATLWFSNSIFFPFNWFSHISFISFKYLFNFSPKLYNLIVFKLLVTFVANIPQNSPYNLVLFSIKNFRRWYFWAIASISCSASPSSPNLFFILLMSCSIEKIIKSWIIEFVKRWIFPKWVLTALRLNFFE